MVADEWRQIVHALGTTVRELRRLLGWSQQQLADHALVSQGAISRMEAGNSAAVPFHSVVVVLRTLAAGAAGMDLPLSPVAAQMLGFAQGMNGGFTAIDTLDPDLAYVARTIGRIPARRRGAFLRVVRELATALGADDAVAPDPDDPAPALADDDDDDDDADDDLDPFGR